MSYERTHSPVWSGPTLGYRPITESGCARSESFREFSRSRTPSPLSGRISGVPGLLLPESTLLPSIRKRRQSTHRLLCGNRSELREWDTPVGDASETVFDSGCSERGSSSSNSSRSSSVSGGRTSFSQASQDFYGCESQSSWGADGLGSGSEVESDVTCAWNLAEPMGSQEEPSFSELSEEEYD